jgi:ElaA protein
MHIAAATLDELDTCLAIRRVVFIEGQDVPEHEEVDGRDPDCLHYIGRLEGTASATARVLPLGEKAKIQRVAVLEQARSGGAGSKLMRFILDDLRGRGFEAAVLGSQTHAIGFYKRLGFEAYGPEYDDAGIPHRDMSLKL